MTVLPNFDDADFRRIVADLLTMVTVLYCLEPKKNRVRPGPP